MQAPNQFANDDYVSEVITLNVGGMQFCTRRSTLLHTPSFFSALVSFNTNHIFVDRDGTHFRYILNWLRGVRFLPEDDQVLKELEWEADYYCIESLVSAIRSNATMQPSVALSMRRIADEMRQVH